MLPQDIPFVLFANCLPVRGAGRAVICDVQRRDYKFIPLVLFEILTTLSGRSIREVKAVYEEAAAEMIDEYFQFLLEGEYVFFTGEPELFPPLELHWETPSVITNAILDIGADSCWPIADVLHQLDELGCKHVQWRCFDTFPLSFFENLLDKIETSSIQSVEIYLRYDQEISFRNLFDLCNQYHRVATIYVHDAPEDTIAYTSNFGMGNIIYCKQWIKSSDHCGIVAARYFNVNLPSYTEAIHYNSCLNKKIAVDRFGWIRNCPSMTRDYGHVSETRLSQALQNPLFASLWPVTKDQINTCRDCEFRFICTDCRAFLKDEDQIDGKPLKCSYDPYRMVWDTPDKVIPEFSTPLSLAGI